MKSAYKQGSKLGSKQVCNVISARYASTIEEREVLGLFTFLTADQ